MITINSIEREQDSIKQNQPVKYYEEMKRLEDENKKLNFLFDLQEKILEEYQFKFGNEIYDQVKSRYDYDIDINKVKIRKDFLEHIGIIKEYDMQLIVKDNLIEALNENISQLNDEVERLIKSEQTLREKNIALSEEKAELLRKIVDINPLVGNKDNEKMRDIYEISNACDINEYKSLMNNQKEELLQLVERYKNENEKLNVLCSSLTEKYNEIQNDFNILSNEYEDYKENNNMEEVNQVKSGYNEKVQFLNNQQMALQNEIDLLKEKLGQYALDEEMRKKEIGFYKENYDDLEHRKTVEVDFLNKEISTYKNIVSDFKSKYELSEESLSSIKFELNRLKEELMNRNEDYFILSKALDESNRIVNMVNEKEEKMEMTIGAYKKKADEAVIEKEKANLRLRLVEQQLNKLSSDFNMILHEKQSKHETLHESIQMKYKEMISMKDEEIKKMKMDLITIQVEKDKYYNEYSLMKGEYDKLVSAYRSENEKYINKFDLSEKRANQTEENLKARINELQSKLEKAENSKLVIEKEMKINEEGMKQRNNILSRLSSVDENREKEIFKLKERFEIEQNEKEELVKEVERLKSIYELKLKRSQEQNEIKYGILLKSMKIQKSQYSEVEDKAFEMMKRQEGVRNI